MKVCNPGVRLGERREEGWVSSVLPAHSLARCPHHKASTGTSTHVETSKRALHVAIVVKQRSAVQSSATREKRRRMEGEGDVPDTGHGLQSSHVTLPQSICPIYLGAASTVADGHIMQRSEREREEGRRMRERVD